ncbi:unnamed protein product [Nezara viridula]|uniref:Uncharacterized protein n=1 Tax=Nezara viridula TaxID=85310 RepID=A0A9P0HLI5_NEZVI|nr:unnamed protein product [Nezara viridula]
MPSVFQPLQHDLKDGIADDATELNYSSEGQTDRAHPIAHDKDYRSSKWHRYNKEGSMQQTRPVAIFCPAFVEQHG